MINPAGPSAPLGDNPGVGAAVAVADFTEDGVDDVAVGARGGGPFEFPSGAVYRADGRRGEQSLVWRQEGQGAGWRGASEAGDGFGSALSAGDFDGDGVADLAVGIPGENDWRGRVAVRHRSGGQVSFSRSSPDIPGDGHDDSFGGSLAAGDFDGDQRDDLAVTADSFGDYHSAGSATVLYGTADGLGAGRSQLWTQATPGVPGAAEDYDAGFEGGQPPRATSTRTAMTTWSCLIPARLSAPSAPARTRRGPRCCCTGVAGGSRHQGPGCSRRTPPASPDLRRTMPRAAAGRSPPRRRRTSACTPGSPATWDHHRQRRWRSRPRRRRDR